MTATPTQARQCQAFEAAICEFAKQCKAEIEHRKKPNGKEIDEYNSHVVIGMELAYAILVDAMHKQQQIMQAEM